MLKKIIKKGSKIVAQGLADSFMSWRISDFEKAKLIRNEILLRKRRNIIADKRETTLRAAKILEIIEKYEKKNKLYKGKFEKSIVDLAEEIDFDYKKIED